MTAPEPGVRTSVFAYVNDEYSVEYRACLAVFAGTFFAELTPADVTARLSEAGRALPEADVASRLESLRRWGNLEVSRTSCSPRAGRWPTPRCCWSAS